MNIRPAAHLQMKLPSAAVTITSQYWPVRNSMGIGASVRFVAVTTKVSPPPSVDARIVTATSSGVGGDEASGSSVPLMHGFTTHSPSGLVSRAACPVNAEDDASARTLLLASVRRGTVR